MNIKRSETWKTADGKYKCPICSKCFTSMGICSHIWRIHDEDGKNHDTTKFLPCSNGQPAWNKGLTKETDDRIRLIAESVSLFYSTHDAPFKGRHHNIESKKKISDAAKRGIENGTWHTGNSWVGVIEHVSPIAGTVYLMGNWELEYAKYLDSHNVNWKHNKKRFKYVSDYLPTKTGFYKPDFYLIDDDCYVEIKGYETQLDLDKWKDFPNKLKILRGKDLIDLGLNIQ